MSVRTQRRTRPTETLAHMLVSALSQVVQTCIDPPRIDCAEGYYKQLRADVMPWTCTVASAAGSFTVGSWDTVTECVRQGIEIHDRRGERHRYADFEVSAKEQRP